MNRLVAWCLSGVAACAVVAAPAAAKEKTERGTFQAQRAGWLLGMYLGEEKLKPYPFILQVDNASEAFLKGVRPGDELIRFQDEEIRSLPNLFEKVNRMKAGREVTFWVRRGVQNIQVQIRVPREPGAPADETKSAAKKPSKDGKEEAKGDAKEGDKPEEGARKPKRKLPVVVKPIPADN